MKRVSKTAILLASSAVALATNPAIAQTAPATSPAATPATPTSSDGQASDQSDGLKDIVVTAQRRQDNLQRTPIAITALAPADLQSRNVQTAQDLMQVTPGLQVSTQAAGNSGGSATFFLRGMGQQRSGNGTSPAVGIYIDDFYYPSLQGAVFSILDLQQVEVLRGPQGTLFGRNTIGGAIRYTTQRPEFDKIGGYIQGTLGSNDRRDVSGSLNLGLTDWAAIRITAGRLRTDGYVRQQNGGKDAGATSTDLLRGQLRLKPAANLEINLSGQYSVSKLDGFAYYVPAPITAAIGLPAAWNHTPAGILNPYDSRYASQCDYCQAGTNKRELSDTRYSAAMGTVTWDVSPTLSIKSLTGWQRVKASYLKDLDASPLPITDTVSSGIDRAFSQELQINGRFFDDRLNAVLGGYYYDEKHTDLFPEAGAQTNLGGTLQPTLLTGLTKTKAAFVDGTFKVTDQFTLIGGLRYSVDDKSAVVRSVAGATIASIAKNFGSTTWRAGAQFQAAPSAMIYATVSRGFRAGGFAKISSSSPVLDPFEPETATNYEIGSRLDLLDRHLRLNPTLFYTTWNNIQLQRVVSGPTGAQIFVDNAARAHSQGFELESEAVITRNFKLTGTLALLDIKYDEVGSTTTVTVNSHFQRAPKVTYSVGANYKIDIDPALRVALSANWSWEGNQYSAPGDNEQLLLPSYGLLNARIDISNPKGPWSFAVFATNLTNKVYYVGGSNLGNVGTGTAQFDLGRPREFGVTARLKF